MDKIVPRRIKILLVRQSDRATGTVSTNLLKKWMPPLSADTDFDSLVHQTSRDNDAMKFAGHMARSMGTKINGDSGGHCDKRTLE